DPAADVEAGEDRHHDVEDDEVRLLEADIVDGLAAATDDIDLVALLAQPATQEGDRIDVVVDDQDVLPRHRSDRPGSRRFDFLAGRGSALTRRRGTLPRD